ncbi:restriction endonuclease subunit S [Afipia sp. DC4300-2b1]|uniref:restriction endonuclease subunit S n=1 Tax=Afipia sp. DC4300-2b1 TaxID=2804672 RepID=UPI003CE85EFF
MNAERLLAHYEKIADAPDAIARLRRFILDLAVRGKLVPPNANDEPASELFKRIATEKARLVKAGAFREPSSFVKIERKALPFEPASHWGWARLIEIARPSYGFAFTSGNFNAAKRGMPLIRIRDISSTDTEAYFEGDYDPAYLVTAGDYLVGMDGDFNLRRWTGPDGLLNQRVMRINGWRCGIDPEFVKLPLQFILDHLHGQTSLTTVKHLSAKQVNGIEIPLPPLAEQHRIVAKVDELMGLCDRLEAARAGHEAKRDRLATASFARLSAPDSETFQSDARFVLDALPVLTTRPDQIKALRQIILNLAVRGKLVPQDTNDEPASELLKRIVVENKKLMAAKGIRAQKPALPAENFEADSEIPQTWCHVYLQDIAYQITDGTHLTPKYTETGKPFLSAQNVKPFRFMPEKHRFVSKTDFDNYRANRRPERGDILMTRVGAGIGEAAVLDSDFEFAFYVSLCLIKIPKRFVSVDYLVLWLNSPEGRESSTIRTYGKGASQGNLNLGLIRTFKIPLPPLAEQHRIVAKVDALMALCDRLEASLAATAATRRRLLDALLAEALAPIDDRELAAAE